MNADVTTSLQRLRGSPLERRLVLLLAGACGLALLLACAAFAVERFVVIKRETVTQSLSIADLLSANLTAAVAFEDAVNATDTLSSLHRQPEVQFGCVYGRNGQPLATYTREELGNTVTPPAIGEFGYEFTPQQTLLIFRPIADQDEQLGAIYLQVELAGLYAQFSRFAVLASGILIAALVGSIVAARQFLVPVTVPIIDLAATAMRISRERDFSLRVQGEGDGEIGHLYAAFNQMLAEIETGQQRLQVAHDELETRVEERTRELTQANAELREVQQQLVDTARRAGMAEIATNVLHNVGNVLNSVNISAGMIIERLRKFGVANLQRVTGLFEENSDNLASYITEDERGQHVPELLIGLADHMASQEEALLTEIQSLSENINHIKDIVAVQQTYAGISGLTESFSITELIEAAISINVASIHRHHITIGRDFGDFPNVVADRQKLLLVLVNLISNAKHSLIASSNRDRRITVRLTQPEEDALCIEVSDNGIGIASDVMPRIFAHGFTTRKDGHGFGLHSAALAAEELGGTLSVNSDGPGKGATFTLQFPVSVTVDKA